METTDYAATIWEGEGEMQPEGGLTLEDISGAEDFDEDTLMVFDETEESEAQPNGAESEPAPTTEQPDAAAEGEEPEASPTPEKAEETEPKKLAFRAKIDRQEQDVEINASDLPGIYQRANNFDRLQKRYEEQREAVKNLDVLAAQLGYESAAKMLEHATQTDREERINALVQGGTARDIAEDYVDRDIARRKSRKAAAVSEPEEPEKDSDTPPAKSGKTAHAGTEPDYRQQIADLFSARPELRGKLQKLPDEVSRAVVENGLPLRTAYAEWEARQVKAENDRIRKEKELFAQQAETASRAPVRGATDGNINETKKPDPFITAFRADRGY